MTYYRLEDLGIVDRIISKLTLKVQLEGFYWIHLGQNRDQWQARVFVP
jgi:hypothetical protein